ncbi:MAG TPA: sigma factor-like helix-turn-helix DNA-binding protein [Terracidiphilus sp.]|nr:sigma factor-like helix-turn-helix DNA-binding protein [Terracidiphilus sp.]
MSAALLLPEIWAQSSLEEPWPITPTAHRAQPVHLRRTMIEQEEAFEPPTDVELAFYRKHTEKMLRRYLYASLHVGRAPSILSDPVARGMVSSRASKTFEDAVIFVLDVERCLDRLGSLEKQILSRIVLQDYTQWETAALLGMSTRTVGNKYRQALDRLTEQLLAAGLLIISG